MRFAPGILPSSQEPPLLSCPFVSIRGSPLLARTANPLDGPAIFHHPAATPADIPAPMNDDPKDTPIRTLLEDIRDNQPPPGDPRRGLISPRLMDRITFFAAIVCLLTAAGVFVGMIWGLTPEVFGFRLVATLGVFMFALLGFRAINTWFE